MIKLRINWKDRRIMTERDFVLHELPKIIDKEMTFDEGDFEEWLEESYTMLEILNEGFTKEFLLEQFKSERLQDAICNAKEIAEGCWDIVEIVKEDE